MCSPYEIKVHVLALRSQIQAYVENLATDTADQLPLLVSIRGSSPLTAPQWCNDPLLPATLNSVGLPESFNVPGKQLHRNDITICLIFVS